MEELKFLLSLLCVTLICAVVPMTSAREEGLNLHDVKQDSDGTVGDNPYDLEDKRSHVFRYGKRAPSVFRYGKRAPSVFRYGKRYADMDEDAVFGKRIFRYGKRSGDLNLGEALAQLHEMGSQGRERRLFRYGKRVSGVDEVPEMELLENKEDELADDFE